MLEHGKKGKSSDFKEQCSFSEMKRSSIFEYFIKILFPDYFKEKIEQYWRKSGDFELHGTRVESKNQKKN